MASADDFLVLYQDEPWPNGLVEAMASYPDPDPETEKFLSYQVAIRIRRGHTVPPRLQDWFNRYAVDGGHVRKRLPDQSGHDRMAIAGLQASFNMSTAEAIRRVAEATGRSVKAVEYSVYKRS